jgi:hypothetical protein
MMKTLFTLYNILIRFLRILLAIDIHVSYHLHVLSAVVLETHQVYCCRHIGILTLEICSFPFDGDLGGDLTFFLNGEPFDLLLGCCSFGGAALASLVSTTELMPVSDWDLLSGSCEWLPTGLGFGVIWALGKGLMGATGAWLVALDSGTGETLLDSSSLI